MAKNSMPFRCGKNTADGEEGRENGKILKRMEGKQGKVDSEA